MDCTMTHREAREQVAQLVDNWQSLSVSALRDYNEENTKNVFIQPLFEALGWDFQDLSQVTAEHSTGRGRVDYAFRVNGFAILSRSKAPSRRPDGARRLILS